MDTQSPTLDLHADSRDWHWRKVKDILLRRAVQFGGISVIAAIALIFVFLLSVVYPLFETPAAELVSSFQTPGSDDETIYLAIEEQAEIGMRVTNVGSLFFFDVHSGEVVTEQRLPVDTNNSITSFRVVDAAKGILAIGLRSGDILFFQHQYELEFTESRRIIHPKIIYPYGEQPINISLSPILDFGIGDNDESISLLIRTVNDRILFKSFTKESSFIDDEVTLIPNDAIVLSPEARVLDLLVDPEQEWGYILSQEGDLLCFNLRDKNNPKLQESVRVTERDVLPTAIKFLTGGISLLIGDSEGNLSQWFQVRSEGDLPYRLTSIRELHIDGSPIVSIATEQLRKGAIAASEAGGIKLIYTTSERELLSLQNHSGVVQQLAIAPRADIFISEDSSKNINVWHLENNHPESSMRALWRKVWYEDYIEPDYIWQSSSASSDFEPKFSLVPLTFGTIKAAFYAMLFAMPLAICGAIFTAYFMAPSMRGIVKPTIEIMEALPTVILGFLAGLWLAPYVELHLPGVFSVLILAPLGVVLVALAWWKLPANIKMHIPEGWQAAILILPIIIVTWFCVSASPYLERWMFDGDIRIWMNESLGIGFDQRNALIIGIAMGFAVIPTIFSIAEDAIFSVPKHLTSGSLALGATPWQSLVRVVLPSASPGIFSAVMIGFGRAVGETMIVLMATGNTPVMDFSIFQGMRTLSANVAVELPESEVDSTHYRILFLAAFVLFIFTFFFNTVAEIVRQRLRKKYASL